MVKVRGQEKKSISQCRIPGVFGDGRLLHNQHPPTHHRPDNKSTTDISSSTSGSHTPTQHFILTNTVSKKKYWKRGQGAPSLGQGVFLANSPLPSPSHLPSFPTPPPRTKPAKPEPGRQSDGRDPRCRNQTQPTNQQDPKAQDATNEHSLTEPHTPRRRTSSSLLWTIGRRPRPEK